MQKILLVVSFTIIFGLSIFAQTEEKADWQNYSNPLDGVSVDFPKQPEINIYEDKDGKNFKTFESAKYSTLFNETYYFVMSELPKNYDFRVSVLKTFVFRFTETVEKLKIGGYDAKLYKFKDLDDFYHKIILLETKNRSYIFHTVSQTENYAETDRFFSSIAFRKIESKPIVKTVTSEKYDVRVPPSVSQGGGFAGPRLPNVPNLPTQIQSAPQDQPTNSALKILSQAKPAFTELARYYNILGSVSCKVIFLANGTIGAVTATKKLPFDLTQNAIQAAKAIRFEPAKRNGTPVAVAKTVIYSYITY